MISIVAPVVYADLGSFSLWIRARSIIFITGAAQKVKFSIKDFLGKCDQISRKLWIWSHLLKKHLMENLILLCSVDDWNLVLSSSDFHVS